MSGNMANFVRGGGRSNSPQLGQPSGRAAAANLKVPLKRTTLGLQESEQRHTGARRQSASTVSNPVIQQQNAQRRRSGDGQSGKHDRYDTDAESLDTTNHQDSIVQVKDSQRAGPHYEEEGAEDESPTEEDSYDEDQDDYDEQENGQYDQEQQWPQVLERHIPKDDIKYYQGIVGDGNSYPSTTSGPGEDFLNNWNTGQELSSDNYPPDRESSPSPRPVVTKNHLAHQTARQVRQGPPKAPGPEHAMSKSTNLFHQSAGIRDHQRSNAILTVRGEGAHQMSAAAPAGSQPPTYSQTLREPDPPVNVSRHARPASQALPQRGARHAPGPSHAPPPKVVESALPTTRHAPTRPKDEPVPRHATVEQAPVGDPEPEHIEDYDRPALFDMKFDDLKNENFDTVPRGILQVLSEDMLQKPLVERLEHVQKSLNGNDQDKFFRGLPTREWEEAGDWFFEQFSSIIQRTREARQKKRKLARDFEDEVEKRYRHVAKRQQHVQDALDKMKTQGQGLIPKSPRASKSPK